jgi:hypothetical protein
VTAADLIARHGSARQALLHLGDGDLDRMDDDMLNELFDAAGLGHLLHPDVEPVVNRVRLS